MQHQTQQMDVTQQTEATIMIQRAWGNSPSQGMRKLGEGVTRTSGRKLKPKGTTAYPPPRRPEGAKESGEAPEGHRDKLQSSAPSRRGSWAHSTFLRCPHPCDSSFWSAHSRTLSSPYPCTSPPVPGRPPSHLVWTLGQEVGKQIRQHPSNLLFYR